MDDQLSSISIQFRGGNALVTTEGNEVSAKVFCDIVEPGIDSEKGR